MTLIIVRVAGNRKLVFSYFYICKKHLSSIHYIFNTVLDFQDTALNTKRQNVCSRRPYILVRMINNKQSEKYISKGNKF